MSDALELLEQRIGYSFRRRDLLSLALVHRSILARPGANNEQLEFLGDAVLDLAISDLLMERFPAADEGELSKRRAALVNAKVLARKAVDLDLGPELKLGKGEEKSGGRRKGSILAAAYEAIIGAAYLDGGFPATRSLMARHFQADLESTSEDALIDYKSRLQELTQRLYRETPTYTLVEASGPDHDRAFVAEIRVAGRLCGRGEGKSKKEAEQQAALGALAELGSHSRGGTPMSSPAELPDIAQALGELLQRVPIAERPLLIALAERLAAERYRAWAREVAEPGRSAQLRACAEREEEIARRVEALYPEASSIQRDLVARNPDLLEINRALFAPHPLEQQLVLQSRGERLGAATWRSFARHEQRPEVRDVFLSCALLEEESAVVLESLA